MFSNHRILCVFIMLTCIFSAPVYADGTHPQGIKLDGTAGKIELPGPDYAIKPEYGKQAGSNLFHSFQQFNIHSGESATFSGPASVQNIISRVTGGNASWLDGRLASTIPGADLYFLNPFGVMFGSNATLDLSGSFHVSTADYLRMGDKERFYSTPMSNEVLSVAAPTAFGFLSDKPGKISLDGSFLQVSEGKTLSLIGGDIKLQNSILYAPGGRINMASAASAGEIKLTETGVEADRIETGGNIVISRVNDNSYGDIEVGDMEAGHNGGSVFIRGGNIVMERAVIESFSAGGNSGDIKLNANTLTMNNKAQIVNAILESDQAENNAEKSKTGNVDIEAEKVTLTDGAQIDNFTFGRGDAGNITVRVADTLTISGISDGGIFADSSGAGNAGSIDIRAGQIDIADEGTIRSVASGSGKGGNIGISADNSLSASGKALIAASTSGTGDAGKIDIQAGQIRLSEGSQISGSTFGHGEGATITVRADEIAASGAVNDIPSGIFANSAYTGAGAGNAGDIDIHARQINLTDAGTIRSMTYGPGNGGTIKISADETLSASGVIKGTAGDMPSGIIANSEGTGTGAGNAGVIDIHARQINLTDGGTIRSMTYGPGDGGTIKITADETLSASGTGKKVNPTGINTGSEGGGDAGSIDIQAGQIQLKDGSQIGSSTSGSGEGGTIVINADEMTASSTFYNAPSGIFAESSGTGNAGSVNIHARQINLIGGDIRCETSGSGEGGTIKITADEAMSASSGSLISASSSGIGKAGSIDIQAGQIQLSDGAQFSNSTLGDGEGGTITIRADEVTASGVFKNFASGIYAVSSGTKKAGDIEIHAGQIQLRDGAQLNTTTLTSGEGGTITIRADEIAASGAINDIVSGIFANSSGTEAGAGKAGVIDIHARQINLTDAGTIRSMTYGPGEGGTIKIIADESLNASGMIKETAGDMPSGIITNSQSTGNAGSIDIHARQINLTDGGTIRGMTYGAGDGGTIKIIADESLTASGTGKKVNPTSINNSSEGQGDAGSISIQAGQILLRDGSQIGSSTSGSGEGGKIVINADEMTASSTFYDVPSGIFAESSGTGKAGSVNIHARQLYLSGGGRIIGETSGSGEGGRIKIAADESLSASGKALVSVGSSGTGKAGSIEIQTGQMKLRDGAQLSTTTVGVGEGGKIIIEADEVVSSGLSEDGYPSGIFSRSTGTGNAGEIRVNVADSIRLTDGASVSTEALSAGGGKINVNAGNSIYLFDSKISSTVKQGQGNGGDVATRSKFVILNHGKITANAQDGDGGAVFIQTQNFLKSADSRVTATSDRGNQGTVKIEAPDLDLSGALLLLPGTIFDAAQFAPTPCYARSGRTFSSFVIRGPDAVPAPADDLQSLPVSEADAEAVGSGGTSSVSEYLNLSDYFGKKKFSPGNERCEGCNRK